MSQEFDSEGLVLVQDAYGLSGVDAEQQTFLDDGNVSQTLPVEAIARRSRSPLLNVAGLFHAVLRNDHTAAELLETNADPYNPVNPQSGYPVPISRKFDIWFLGAGMSVADGTLLTVAGVGMDLGAAGQMFSELDSTGGVVSTTTREIILAAWDDFTSLDGLITGADVAMDPAGRTFIPLKLRWPRNGSLITFRSLSTAAVTATCLLTFGIFPVALGQDMAG